MSEKITEIARYIKGAHMMRDGALKRLTDVDLSFSPGGDSATLGELFVSLGELQHSYIESIRNRVQDWSYRNSAAGISSDIEQLQGWFAQLDSELETVLGELSDDDLTQNVDRTNGVIRTVERQIGIYNEAMLIFLGKLVVYFQSMSKELPPSIQHYIA